MAWPVMTGVGSRPGASVTAGADVGQLEQAAGRGLVGVEQRERLRQRRDDLEAGERDERQEREVDAVEPPRADELDADGQDRHRRQAREGRGQARPRRRARRPARPSRGPIARPSARTRSR